MNPRPTGPVERWLALEEGPGLLQDWPSLFPGEDHVFDRFDRAMMEHTRRHPGQALEAVEKALRLLPPALDSTQRARLTRLHAHALRSCGQADKAIEKYEAAARAFARQKDRREAGRTTIGHIDALALNGRRQDAFALAKKGRRLLKGVDALALARLEANVGILHYAVGDLDEAESAWKKALRSFQRRGHDWEGGICAFNLGQVCLWKGKAQAAREYLELARAAYSARKFSEMEATARAGLAGASLLEGEWGEGLGILAGLVEELRAQGSERVAASVERQRAEWLLALGALPAAERSAKAAFNDYRRLGLVTEEAHAAFLHGRLLARLGRSHDSGVQLQRALRHWGPRGQHRFAHHRCSVELGRAHLERGEFEAALDLLRPAIRALDQRDPQGLSAQARIYAARAWMGLGKAGLAARLAKRAHKDARKLPLRLERPAMSLVVAEAAAMQGNATEARRWCAKAVSETEATQLSLHDRALREESAAPRDAVYRAAIDLTLSLGGPRANRSALDYLSRARSAGLVEDLLAGQPSLDPELRVSLGRLRERLLGPNNENDGEDDVRFLAIHEQLKESGGRSLSRSIRPPGLLRRVVEERRLAQWMPHLQHRHLLLFDRIGNDWRAFLAAPGGKVTRVDLPDAQYALRRDWLDLRMLFEAAARTPRSAREGFLERSLPEALETLGRIHDALFAPLPLDDVEELVLVPAGPLHGLPLEAVLEAKGGGPAVRRLPHPALLGPRRRSTARRALLLHGSAGATSEETKSVQRILKSAYYEAERSGKKGALNESGPLSLLHVAAHGIFHRASWMLSGFELTDGWMGLEDLRPTQLKGALIFLGSCESGLAREMPGAELGGWLAAGLAAGAREMILALWKLDDQAAVAFADAFYPAWIGGKEPMEAVAAARAAVRQRHPHPFTWSPYVLVG